MRLLPAAFHNTVSSVQPVVDWMIRDHVKGATVAVIHSGEIAYTGQYGMSSLADTKVKETTLFECASLTKMHFAALALKLCEDGLFTLDVPVMQQFRTDPWSNDPRFYQITPRHILSHTSGLPNWSNRPMPMLFAPGDRFSYSGEGYYLLQQMLEKSTGYSLDHLMETNLFHPLGMNATVLWTPEVGFHFSCGFDAEGKVCKIRDRRRTSGNAPEPNAAWSLYSNASSIARFLSWLLVHHAGLGSIMFSEMTRPCADAGNHVFWGLGTGMCSDDPQIIWHWGDNLGFQSFILGDLATKDGLVVVTNSSCGLEFCLHLVSEWTDFQGISSIRAFLKTAE